MSRREQQRARVLVQVIEGRVIVSEAARLLGLSPRHIKRLVARVRRDGPAALAHGNRGHSSPRRLPDTVRSRVLLLARVIRAVRAALAGVLAWVPAGVLL